MGLNDSSLKKVIFIAGPPASGKTWLGKAIAKHIGAAFLDSDTISQPFLSPNLTKNNGFKDTDEYREVYRDLEYAALFNVMRENLELGISCIVVAPFRKEQFDPVFPENILFEINNFRKIGIFIRIDPEEQLKNLKRRNNPRDQYKISKWYEYLSRQGNKNEEPIWKMDINFEADYKDLSGDFNKALRKIIDIIT